MSTPTNLSALHSQAAFAAALLASELPCPTSVCAWNGADPARRFGVYRNNVVSGLVDALEQTFPVTSQLTGSEFFRAMAALYARRLPPRSPILAHYGAEFPEFIASFPPAATLPYLPDMARLELACVAACHAADAAPVGMGSLAAQIANPAELAVMRLRWQPSLRVIGSAFAVVTLWSVHQRHDALSPVDIERAEQAVVLRDGLEVLVLPIDAGGAHFISRTLAGLALGVAAADAVEFDPGFDLGDVMARLLCHDALVAMEAPDIGAQFQE